MAGKFEISKNADSTFTFDLKIDDVTVASSTVFEKEDECKRGVKAVKKNSRMKVQNMIAGDEEKTNPKFLVEANGDEIKYTLFLQTGAVACSGSAKTEEEALKNIELIGNNANAAPIKNPNRTLVPTLNKRLPTKEPLEIGENTASAAIT